MMKLAKTGLAALSLAILAACGGGSSTPATPVVATPTPSVATAPVTAPQPIVTPPVAAPLPVVTPPVPQVPTVVIPPVTTPPVIVIPPTVVSTPAVVAPPIASPVPALPASGAFTLATVASLNACPSVPFLTGDIFNWSTCLVGQKFVGTPPFGSGTCELLVRPNSSFTYTDNSGSYTMAPTTAQLVPSEASGGYMNRLDGVGRTSFTGILATVSAGGSTVEIEITSLRSAGAANSPGSLDSATVSFKVGFGATKVCQLTGF